MVKWKKEPSEQQSIRIACVSLYKPIRLYVPTSPQPLAPYLYKQLRLHAQQRGIYPGGVAWRGGVRRAEAGVDSPEGGRTPKDLFYHDYVLWSFRVWLCLVL